LVEGVRDLPCPEDGMSKGVSDHLEMPGIFKSNQPRNEVLNIPRVQIIKTLVITFPIDIISIHKHFVGDRREALHNGEDINK
jgi:hypothetical protein